MSSSLNNFELDTYGSLCDSCGIPLDAERFDRSAIRDVEWGNLGPGAVVSISEYQLRPQYCGLLEGFSQFTDRWAADQEYRTPGLRWSVRLNGRPLFPYESVEHIVNPWGYGSFCFRIRLDESALVQLVATRVADPGAPMRFDQLGGRIWGRYWYNPAYGGGSGSCG